MQPGTRVVFWEDAGRMKHGSVQSIGFIDVRVSLSTVALSRLKSHLCSGGSSCLYRRRWPPKSARKSPVRLSSSSLRASPISDRKPQD